jgi:1-acyl-sn-glycerol-3-phosphate acyltransferase
MRIGRRFLLGLFRLLTGCIFRIDAEQLRRVPLQGPLILVTNHVNIWEIPISYLKLQPRPVHGLVLSTRWNNRLLAWVLNACEAIPLERGSPNIDSLKRALEVLQRNEIVAIAPEGTRSGDGRLQRGHGGVVVLAMLSKAPLLPVAFYGGENYRQNLLRLRRTDFHYVVGEPFRLIPDESLPAREARQAMADEVMLRLAGILPDEYRGVYRDRAVPSPTLEQALPFASRSDPVQSASAE